MTDRNPDDWYDALRDRLANYGQEPPAPLWASIRAQLPPPISAPQLRRRRRARAAWLGLLLLLVGIGSWQGWQLSHPAHRNRLEVTTRNQSPPTETRISTNNHPTTLHPATTATVNTANSGATGPATSAALEASMGARTAAVEGRAPAVAREEPRETTTATNISATPKHGRSTGKKTSQPSSGDALANGVLATSTGGAVRTAGPTGRYDVAGAAAPTVATGRPNATPSEEAHARKLLLYSATINRAKKRRGAGRPGAVATAEQLAVATTAPKASAKTSADQHDAILPSAAPAKAARSMAAGAVPAVTQLSAGAPAEPISFAAWGRLQPRSVALLPVPLATPTVLTPTDTLPHPGKAAVSRWAVQLLAGPALTYRRLGSSGTSALQAIPSAPVNFYNQAGDRTSVAAQERPTAGFGAQVQVQRVLNGRWTMSSGLGYQVYATRLALQTVPVSAAAPNSFPMNAPPRIIDSTKIRSTNLRDTYRFVTVPVRVSYWMGVGGRHLRFGLLGGADAAFYLGGATSEGSTCGCTSQTWGPSGSPYRSLSLSLSLGVDLRYRLGPRWELLAQPTGTYFLTPLARPASGFAPRYLLGGSTLLGISYGLR